MKAGPWPASRPPCRSRPRPPWLGPVFVLALLLAAAAASAQSAGELLNAGKKAFSDGFYPVAEESFQKLLSQYPQDSTAVEAEYLLGVSDHYSGRWQECLVALDGFPDRHPASALSPRVPYWLGASYLRLGSYEKAVSLLSAIAGPVALSQATGPYAQHAALLRGVALEALGRDSQAAGLLPQGRRTGR